MSATVHTSVLLQEAVSILDPKDGDTVLDATLGGAGHARALLERADIKLVGLDADTEAIRRATQTLSGWGSKVRLKESYFADLSAVLDEMGLREISHALFDLGLSSDELETSGKGFSFRKEEELLMTFGTPPLGITARDLLNTWDERDIANVLFGYGEEHYAKRIAKEVVRTRATREFRTTTDLVAAIERAVPAGYRRGKRHFATKSFQALRVAVNDELAQLKEGLAAATERLAHGGRIAVITFESITDRIVKEFFKTMQAEGTLTILTKKPLAPSQEEQRVNPRARSAKLRAAQKL